MPGMKERKNEKMKAPDGARTNADKIRAMSDEELAIMLDSGCPKGRFEKNECPSYESCCKCWLDWLRQEVSDDD